MLMYTYVNVYVYVHVYLCKNVCTCMFLDMLIAVYPGSTTHRYEKIKRSTEAEDISKNRRQKAQAIRSTCLALWKMIKTRKKREKKKER